MGNNQLVSLLKTPFRLVSGGCGRGQCMQLAMGRPAPPPPSKSNCFAKCPCGLGGEAVSPPLSGSRRKYSEAGDKISSRLASRRKGSAELPLRGRDPVPASPDLPTTPRARGSGSSLDASGSAPVTCPPRYVIMPGSLRARGLGHNTPPGAGTAQCAGL